ncbi:acyltransferase [Achromobacter kerstersii]|uniref:O-acetyltransferase WecH n=2 Tax=Achromobacter kerstersii TaxID=1353890 RepID=A0A6S6ZUV1_9BURK|nr:acyltransferase family protein [Achromobacter kerstersii]CAB3693240.1 O-acetyltransferase WecH [Achromobacter kerstersii]
MHQTEDRYARLDAARWLAAVAVVLLHSAALIVSDPAAYGGGAWLAANLYDSAARWCVPVFVMVSGALLLDPHKPQDARQFYSRRMARICAPLVFWTLFYLAWRTGLDWWDDGRVDFSFWPRKVAQGEPYYHLWYLYMIVGLYLFAPLARLLYARSTPRGRALWVVGILGVAILDALYRRALGAPHGFFLTWFLPYLGYFVAGRLIFDGDMRIPRPGLMLMASVAATALGVSVMSNGHALDTYFYDYFSLTVPFMSLAAFQWIVSSPRLPRLTALAPLTFGVYLIHPVFLDIAHRAGAFTGGQRDAWIVPLLTLAVFALSAASSWLMRRHPATRRLV